MIAIGCSPQPASESRYVIRLQCIDERYPRDSSSYIEVSCSISAVDTLQMQSIFYNGVDSVSSNVLCYEVEDGLISTSSEIIYLMNSRDTIERNAPPSSFGFIPYSHRRVCNMGSKVYECNGVQMKVYKFYEDNGAGIESNSYAYYLKNFGVILVQSRSNNIFYALSEARINNTQYPSNTLQELPKIIMTDSSFCLRKPKYVPDSTLLNK